MQQFLDQYSVPIAGTFIILFLVIAGLSVRGQSSTWDDPPHLTAGLSYLQTGDPRLNVDHPPLARLVGALPALFLTTQSVSGQNPSAWQSGDINEATNTFFPFIESGLLWPGRLSMLVFSLLLGVLIYAWARDLFGNSRALVPVIVFAFCPPLLANAPLITTDMPITALMFASLYGWRNYLVRPRIRTLLWTSLSVCAAFATKYSALMLVPLFLLLAILAVALDRSGTSSRANRAVRLLGALLIIGFITLTGINGIYLFDGSFQTPVEMMVRAQQQAAPFLPRAALAARHWPASLPIPLPFEYAIGLSHVIYGVKAAGHATYFLGEASNGGWPNYFLMLLLIKLPLASLALIFLGIFRGIDRLPDHGLDLGFLLLPPVALFWVASTGKMQIGIRHLLPVLPFLLVLTGYLIHQGINRANQALIGALLLSNSWSSWSVHPYYLMYFNFLAGGPDQGWRISVTGDDYGQGDRELLAWLQARGIKQLAFGAFGHGQHLLALNGIQSKPVPCQDTGKLVAIHAGRLLLGSSLEQQQCYAWMRYRVPDEKISYSIFLYNSRNATQQDAEPTPPNELGDFQQALKLQLAGNLEGAITLYQDYLRREPSYFQARFNLGHALMSAGRCAEAIPEFQRTLELWPGYTETHVHLARCHRALNQMDFARKHEQEYEKSQTTP